MSNALAILVVDDDCDNADTLAELFTLDGHEVEIAYSGEQAIVAFGRRDFDLAFMDVMMPGRNGVESFLEIKRMKPHARVYMMTGYSVERLLQQAIDNGALGVLTKPVDPEKVLRALAKIETEGIVLVAEDDADFGPELQRIIVGTGRTCELVTNGQDAITRVGRGDVDVLILDLNMPLVNGIEVYAALRKSGKAVPTVIMTGCSDQYHDALESLADVDLTGILNKPFDPAVLLTKLDRLAA